MLLLIYIQTAVEGLTYINGVIFRFSRRKYKLSTTYCWPIHFSSPAHGPCWRVSFVKKNDLRHNPRARTVCCWLKGDWLKITHHSSLKCVCACVYVWASVCTHAHTLFNRIVTHSGLDSWWNLTKFSPLKAQWIWNAEHTRFPSPWSSPTTSTSTTHFKNNLHTSAVSQTDEQVLAVRVTYDFYANCVNFWTESEIASQRCMQKFAN